MATIDVDLRQDRPRINLTAGEPLAGCPHGREPARARRRVSAVVAREASRGRIVVGVTGSRTSWAALAWALEMGKERCWDVDVVSVWPDLGEAFVREAPGHFCQSRSRAVDALAAAWAACEADPATEATVRVWVENADPVEALVTRSAGADLLVVGAPRDGRSRRAGCPAVGATCRSLASCPVVVVDEADRTLRASA